MSRRNGLSPVVMILALATLTPGCAATPHQTQTLAPQWSRQAPNRVVVFGFHSRSGRSENGADTVRTEEWWDGAMNETLARSLAAAHPERQFVGPTESTEALGQGVREVLVGVNRAVARARTGSSVDFANLSGPWLTTLLDANHADAVYLGFMVPVAGWYSSGNLVAKNRFFQAGLRVQTALIDRDGAVLWETRETFPTVISRSFTVFGGSGPDTDPAVIWRANGPSLARKCLDHYGELFPGPTATMPPISDEPQQAPLLIPHTEGLRVQLPSDRDGMWIIRVADEHGTEIRAFQGSGGKVDWDYTDRAGEPVPSGFYDIEVSSRPGPFTPGPAEHFSYRIRVL